jgi:hypothetical protein
MRLYFALLTIVLMGGAAVLFVRRWRVARSGVNATGKVVAFETREDEGTPHYLPVVDFVDGEGRSHRFTSVAGSARQHPPMGSLVTVRYLADRPGEVFIVSFLHLWAAPLALFVLGLGAWWACLSA